MLGASSGAGAHSSSLETDKDQLNLPESAVPLAPFAPRRNEILAQW
jgi:hypothetical protein